jgi:hypothetical protein
MEGALKRAGPIVGTALQLSSSVSPPANRKDPLDCRSDVPVQTEHGMLLQ